jgi:hypothetical protein
MAVYVDDAIWPWHGLKWCHLLADDLDELHCFAASLGIQRTSYQGPPKTGVPHYDLTGFERRKALALGAVACTRAAILAVVQQVRPRKRPGMIPKSGNRFSDKIMPESDNNSEGGDHAQSLGPQHVVQRAEGDVGDRRDGARL